MHGAASASRSILPWTGTVTGSSRRRATPWAASIEDWPSSLNGTSRRRGSTGTWSSNLSDWWRWWSCVYRARTGLRHDDAPSRWWRRNLGGHWFHYGMSGRTRGGGCYFRRAGCWRCRYCRPRLRRSRRSNHWRAHFYTRCCRSCRTDARCNATCWRTHFYTCRWRLGNYGACGWLGGNGRRRRRRSHDDPRFLTGLGHNPSRRWRRRRRRALTLSAEVRTTQTGGTQVRPRQPWRTLYGNTLADWLVGSSRDRRSGWRNWRCRTRHCRRLHRRSTLYGSDRSGARNYRTRWNARPGCVRLSGLRGGWTLGYGRSFVLALLNGLEHVARLRNP
jgi:hypothetical protein